MSGYSLRPVSGDSQTPRSALVPGGAGFIGSHVVEALMAAGVERVAVLDDLSLGRRANVPDGAHLTLGNAADLDALCELANEPFDLCVNLAVIPLPHSLEHPREHVDANVAMTTAVCELGREGGYRKLVQYSSSEVYGTARKAPMPEDHPLRPHTPYAAAKAATDLVALSYHATFGLPVAVVRPFNTYGPRQNDAAYAGLIPKVIADVRAGRPVTIHGDGEQTRDMTFVTDVAAGTIAAARSEAAVGEVTNLGHGSEHSVNAMVGALLEGLGAPGHPVEHGPQRPGDVRRLLADTTVASERFGYAPSVGIEEGMRRTVEWYLSR